MWWQVEAKVEGWRVGEAMVVVTEVKVKWRFENLEEYSDRGNGQCTCSEAGLWIRDRSEAQAEVRLHVSVSRVCALCSEGEGTHRDVAQGGSDLAALRFPCQSTF
jgi:hypothetical protein